jgi:hypothetical protein
MSMTGGGAGGGAAADAALRRFFLGAGPGGSVIVGIICGDLNSGGVPPIGILGNQSKSNVTISGLFLVTTGERKSILYSLHAFSQFSSHTALKITR